MCDHHCNTAACGYDSRVTGSGRFVQDCDGAGHLPTRTDDGATDWTDYAYAQSAAGGANHSSTDGTYVYYDDATPAPTPATPATPAPAGAPTAYAPPTPAP